jgi:hypothetical protein
LRVDLAVHDLISDRFSRKGQVRERARTGLRFGERIRMRRGASSETRVLELKRLLRDGGRDRARTVATSVLRVVLWKH